jgi:hypothetical protein
MGSHEYGFNNLLETAIENLVKRVDADQLPSEHKNRIQDELLPVITSLKSWLEKTAETIATGKSNQAELIKGLETTFLVYGCKISIDDTGEYTSNKNPASIQYIDGKLLLKVAVDFKDSQKPETGNTYLKELIHELVALLLIQGYVEKNEAPIISNQMLDVYKGMLRLGNTKVWLTHIADLLLLTLIDNYKKQKRATTGSLESRGRNI